MPNEDKNTSEVYIPTDTDVDSLKQVLKDWVVGQSVISQSYNQLNGRSLYEAIDDWTKRFNGYITAPSDLVDSDQSRIFLNFTRNQVIAYLSKVALNRPKTKIKAVSNKTGMPDQKFSDVLEDLNEYSSNEENGDARFLEAALEVTTKGTMIVYEGYRRDVQKMKVPNGFDMMTGKGKFKDEERIVFDNCYQEIVPIEDFFIANPYQADVQKQPFIIWRRITTFSEAEGEYGHYKNFKYVTEGTYPLLSPVTSFFRNNLMTDLKDDQVEILRYYNRSENQHVVVCNGVVIYDGPIPFRDGKYPFAKGIFEPYGNDFFWGAGFPQKIMGDQDLLNTFWNMMIDKTYGSLLPYGLSSDLDDMIEDDSLQVNKIRKVGDINKWKFDTLPGVNAGEQAMLQTALKFAQDNSGVIGGGPAATARGGKLSVRQVLLQQQDAMQKLGFPMTFLEDFERDRVSLRISHILQFYSIPKIEKIAGKSGQEIQQMVYRDVKLSDTQLSDGKTGNKVIKLVQSPTTPDDRQALSNNLSVTEAMGEQMGTPTEALAVSVDTFYDYNLAVQVIKASSYEKNAALDQAARMEYANWRLSIMQVAPLDGNKLVEWVDESFDVDSDQFKPEQQQQGMPGIQGAPPTAPAGPPGTSPPNLMQQIKPSSMSSLSSQIH